jgi:SlyX protein
VSDDERVLRLEEKVAYLERHVTAQDKVMLELGDELARLRGELRMMRDRASGTTDGGNSGDAGEMADERPPHY